jgi:hypothetical protein
MGWWRLAARSRQVTFGYVGAARENAARAGHVRSRRCAWVAARRTDRRSAARGGHGVHGGHGGHSTHGRAVGGHGTHGGWSRPVTSLRTGLGRHIDCRSAARGGRGVHGAVIASYVAARTYWRRSSSPPPVGGDRRRLGSAHACRTNGTMAGSHRARRNRCHRCERRGPRRSRRQNRALEAACDRKQ